MDKKKKYEFNQQTATLKLREPINEGRVMFTIDDDNIDSLFNKQFEADVDYIHDGPDVYYVTDQNDLERFVDYVESMGLDGDAIQIQQYMKEEGSVTGGESYAASLNAPSKKQNPFKEDALSGYKELKGFKPGHTPDKGGFQYKELWEGEDLEAIKNNVISWSKSQRNTTNSPLETNWWKHFDDTIRNAKSKQEIKAAILDMYYMGDFDWNKLGLDEIFTPNDYQKVLKIIDKIKYTNVKLYNTILAMIDDIYPHDYSEVEAQLGLNENYNRFRNETKTRSGSEQYHQAVKAVRKKVQEIGKLHTYLERMQRELSETKDGLKKKKYTEIAIQKIKEAVRDLNNKVKKLK